MPIEIRELTLEEIPHVAQVDTSSLRVAVYDLVPPETGAGLLLKKRSVQPPIECPSWGANEIATRMALWQRNLAEGCKFWGAFSDGRLVGFLLLSAQEVDGALEIFSIFVDRSLRAKGIGARLIETAEAHARKAGIRSLYVTTTLDGIAIDFYLKTGFRLAGLHSRCYHHPGGQAAFLKEM